MISLHHKRWRRLTFDGRVSFGILWEEKLTLILECGLHLKSWEGIESYQTLKKSSKRFTTIDKQFWSLSEGMEAVH